MVSAVASRVITRPRISKIMAKIKADEASRIIEVSKSAEVPLTINKIPYRAGDYTNITDDASLPNVSMRPMGNSRRVFLLNPHLEAQDFEGLACRVRALSKSESINSLLIATDDQVDYNTNNPDDNNKNIISNNNFLPRFLTQCKEINFSGVGFDKDPEPNHTWYVAGGYDPTQIINIDDNDSQKKIDYILKSLSELAMAVQGPEAETKIPIITMPHGAITDGGYALCMGSFVLATDETSLSILNPSRGLSFDPIGYSYILSRLGWEYEQDSKKYPGCGMIMALSGYEANCNDMVETGLATHSIGDSGILPILEEELATLPAWNQQGLVPKPRKFYGQSSNINHQNNNHQQHNFLQQQLQRNPIPTHVHDVNQKFRNRSVAHIINQISDVAADSSNEFPFDFTAIYEDGNDDASLDTEYVPYDAGFFSSPLVGMAAGLDDIFRHENSLDELTERLKEVAATLDSDSIDEENITTATAAKTLVDRMERQSPLSLRVVYQLMKMGSNRSATMENCMARESTAQRKLMTGDDFRNWLRHVQKFGGDEAKAPPFRDWKYSTIKEVTAEEVEELLS
mmetsp:Transcript_14698/g.16526  ORF Transcript_14698/g.16526 Transcript_14698/m.16526 type:complete len:571 (+) Transcript_14698:145-1857(+)